MSDETSVADNKQQAINQLKNVFDDGFAEINGNKYVFTKFKHEQRREVFAFYSSVSSQVETRNFEFLASDKYQYIENVMFSRILFEEMALTKITDHWETHASDYLTLVCCALGVISYPFLSGNHTS